MNDDLIEFEVPGEPVAKGRAKASTIGGHVRLITPKKTVNFESKVAYFGQHAMAGRPLLDGAVVLHIVCVFQTPKSWSKKRLAANDVRPEPVVKRPDADNLAKAVADGLNGICWGDDAQVSLLIVEKIYGTTPKVAVAIRRAL